MTVFAYQKVAGGRIARTEPAVETLKAEDTIWIDLVSPEPAEEKHVEALFDVDAPTAADRRALEESSRFYVDGHALVLSPTVVTRARPTAETKEPRSKIAHRREVISFILVPGTLITVRDCELRAFEVDAGRASARVAGAKSAQDVFMALLEGLVERVADFLSELATELEALNLSALGVRKTVRLELVLRRLGQMGTNSSQVRDSLASFARLCHFAGAQADAFKLPRDKLGALVVDIETLQRQAEAITNDLTFSLDAMLGLVSARQNETLKIMAIVSLLFAPPTMIASIFGMNFEHMNVLTRMDGFPWSLVAMALSSAVVLTIAKVGKWI
jgi:magnesium transporter